MKDFNYWIQIINPGADGLPQVYVSSDNKTIWSGNVADIKTGFEKIREWLDKFQNET